MTRFTPAAAAATARIMASYGPAPEDESVFVMLTTPASDNEIPGELLEIGGSFRVWAFASPYEVEVITSIREID
jgi:hypothetical protein